VYFSLYLFIYLGINVNDLCDWLKLQITPNDIKTFIGYLKVCQNNSLVS
jgi:hypothetical protein